LSDSQILIIITILVLAIVALVLVFRRKTKVEHKLTPLAGFAFGFILGGIAFADHGRLVIISLMSIGVVLAIIDIITRLRKRKRSGG